jgi:hypothetical protein
LQAGHGNVALFESASAKDLKFSTLDNGNVEVSGLNVFRSGQFKDSMGYESTWEPEHMAQFVSNFELLRDKNTLVHVPVREGHDDIFSSGLNVVGYITKLSTTRGEDPSGNTVTLLQAAFEFTEPDAFGKLKRGTYRARSSEVGMYETNAGEIYWPVFMGFAFVDIPAVEGLYDTSQPARCYDSPNTNRKHFFIHASEEGTVTHPAPGQNQPAPVPGAVRPAPAPGQPNPTPQPVTEPVLPLAPSQQGQPQPVPAGQSGQHSGGGGAPAFLMYGNQTTDVGALQAHISRLEAFEAQGRPNQVALLVNGAVSQDVSAIQTHINALEAFQRETVASQREAFVRQLASDDKILATQIDSLCEFARGLKPEQWSQYRSSWEAAPKVPFLSNHAQGVVNQDGQNPTSSRPQPKPADEYETAIATVLMHRQSGMSTDQLINTGSFMKLKVAGKLPDELAILVAK